MTTHALKQGKEAAGAFAVKYVRQGMTIGIGSGSTVYWFIQELAKLTKEGFQISAVPTSLQTETLARTAGIKILTLNEIETLPLTVDGADEIDPKGNLIKGGGGALLQEKMVASASAELIVIVDSSKLVPRLGKFPLAVEVIPYGYREVQQKIIQGGYSSNVILRRDPDGKIFLTDHHHYILDCETESINDPRALNISLHLIPGVVETGLFIEMATRAIIGNSDGTVKEMAFK